MKFRWLVILLIIIGIIGCTGNSKYFHKESNITTDEIITPSETDYTNLSNEQLLIELNQREIEVDSLYSVIDTLYATIDSLYYELEFINNSLDDASKQIPSNPGFVIPDTITFAGRLVDLRNERIHAKFEEIFNREIKFAYKAIPRSGKYFAIFDSVFTFYNIPLDAKYLAVAESHLSNLASSPVGAVGIWQIMPKTGKEYHLKIDSFVDERRDVFKATEFAAKFLQSNYDYLNQKGAEDWLLAMAAYNAGPGSIARVMREQGSNNFFELILRVEETNDYLWRAIALKMIFEYESSLFENAFIREPPLSETCRIEQVNLKGHYKMDEWAQAQGTTVAMLWELNPWINITKQKRKKYTAINDVVLPPGEYSILVPKQAVKDEEHLAKIEKKFESKNAGYYTYHIVKRGDTLYDIARKYNTSVASLKSLNGMRTNNIRIGQKIKLYSGSYGDTGGDGYHTVRSGETLSHIADKYNIPVAKLKQYNNLKDNVIYPGQKILLGSSGSSSSNSSSSSTEKGTKFHIVQAGETLSHIADKYIIPVKTLQAVNNLKGNTIYPGQKIYLGITEPANNEETISEADSGPNYHVIKKGETLSHVADKYLIPVA
ncbi:MAG: LysM peptidoglycan-binding domain-containing protein, partial [Candidatus Cloacimonetes bacterium]|nr:LysM peptidoglycan-binding domain-containing protein [Candidatus Cloacimonadota bacterium]